MAVYGYARVSTQDQDATTQIEELTAAGCGEIVREQASGGDRDRPRLAALLARVRAGDSVVVVRIDRLARSLSHLLEVIERLERRGAHFRSLRDPIDTRSPQGKFSLQVLGAAAELERALIRERTVAGLASARAAGRRGGNPGLRAGDPAARRKVARARDERYFAAITEAAGEWVPHVRRMRPDASWETVLGAVNAALGQGVPRWSRERLVRAARRYVRDGLLEPRILGRAPPRDRDGRLLTLVSGIVQTRPDITLREIAARLEALHEPTPRGGRTWALSSVKMILDRARAQGRLPAGG